MTTLKKDVEYIREAPGLDQGELLSLSMCPTQDALRLKWELTTEEEDGPLPWRQDPARLQSPLPKFDSQWAIAWGKLTKHQEVRCTCVPIQPTPPKFNCYYFLSPVKTQKFSSGESLVSTLLKLTSFYFKSIWCLCIEQKIQEAVAKDPMLFKQVCWHITGVQLLPSVQLL